VGEGGDVGPEEERAWTAAHAASLTAKLADAAARAAESAEKVAHVGSAVAHELTLPAVCDVVLDETLRTLGAALAAIHLADREQRTLTLLGQRRVPEELAGSLACFSLDSANLVARAARSRKTQTQIVAAAAALDHSAFEQELLARTACQTLIALPLVAHNELVAVLLFGLADKHELAAGEQAALTSCGQVFSFALAHAMQYEEERRLRSLFEAVGHATVAIAAELALRPSLQSIVDEARGIADADYAALGIVVSDDSPFDPWVYSGMSAELAERIGRTPRPVGTLGAVPATDRPVRVADVHQHPAFAGLPANHPEITSFLGVPIRFGGRSVGNLYVANKRRGRGFSAEDQQAIELLAAHAGAVVHQRYLREALDAEHARFKAIVENAPHGVVFVDAATGSLIANPRAVELAGDILRPGADHGGEIAAPDGTPIPRADWPFRRAVRGETVKPQEFLFRHPDGREIPVLISAAPVGSPGARGTVVLFEDISLLKRLQRHREEWGAIITHELRQPITALKASVDMLEFLAPPAGSETFLKVIARARRAMKSLTRFVDDLSDASAIETDRLDLVRQRVELDVLARALVDEQQARNSDRIIALQLGARIPPVEGDLVRIEQVLSNLMTNALKYSPPGTRLDVAVDVVDHEVHVRVTNVGAGIPAEELFRIFERYYRTDGARRGPSAGLGLGLYVAKGIIEAHGGRIWAESRPGETTFEFALPVLKDA
jgi:signal transduction histidine kinase/GAF domain-containing protein